MRVIVQFSLTSTSDCYRNQLEPMSPSAASLLSAMTRLSNAGIVVTCRWQPYVPGKTEHPADFVRRVADSGAKHLALEHLKVPIDPRIAGWRRFESQSGVPWREQYRNEGATRDGREYIFRGRKKLRVIQKVAALARKKRMTFGAADNEYQYLSDTDCCCSGVDQFPGFDNWFKHQIGYAVRKSNGGTIAYESIAQEWSPLSSVDRFLNSHTRLGLKLGNNGTMADHVRFRWNEPSASGSPATFASVVPTERFSSGGFRLYSWEQKPFLEQDS
jgi:hypothetical protein